MKALFLLPFLGLLAACGGATQARPEPITVIKEVAVAVDAPCVPDTLAPPPTYVDTDEALAKGDAADRYQLLWGGRAQRIARANEVEPVIAGCPRGAVKK